MDVRKLPVNPEDWKSSLELEPVNKQESLDERMYFFDDKGHANMLIKYIKIFLTENVSSLVAKTGSSAKQLPNSASDSPSSLHEIRQDIPAHTCVWDLCPSEREMLKDL